MPQSGFAPSSWFRKGEALIGHTAGDLWTFTPSAAGDKWVRLSDNSAIERCPVLVAGWHVDGYAPTCQAATKCTCSHIPDQGHRLSCRQQVASPPSGIPTGVSCSTRSSGSTIPPQVPGGR